MNKKLKRFLIGVVIGLLVAATFKVGFFYGKQEILKQPPKEIKNVNEGKPKQVDFSIFWEAWRKTENNFFDKNKIDYQKMVYGAIEGMLAELDDPYTRFFPPKKTKQFNQELSGKYEGVGMRVAMKDNIITVVSPLEGTPAYKAGLKPEDKIIKVNGTSTQGVSLMEAVSWIKGEAGTEVTLTVSREGWSKPKDFTLKRNKIEIPTLEWSMKKTPEGKSAAYIKIHHFNNILFEKFQEAAFEILKKDTNRIVVDVRNNPGGFLEVARNVAGWFIKEGEPIVIQDFGDLEKENKTYKSPGPGNFSDYKIVALINEGSASASEILAGALRDNLGATIVGEKSFGKGSVQQQLYLSDGSTVKVTISKWLTPSGNSIREKGISPDIKVKQDEGKVFSDKDPQLKKALKIFDQ